MPSNISLSEQWTVGLLSAAGLIFMIAVTFTLYKFLSIEHPIDSIELLQNSNLKDKSPNIQGDSSNDSNLSFDEKIKIYQFNKK